MSDQMDYWDEIEEYCLALILKEAQQDYHASIFHGTVSKDIYDYAYGIIESGVDAVLIRCDQDQFKDSEVHGRFSDVTTRIEFLVCYNKDKNKGYIDQPRNISYLLNRVWSTMRKNPMFIHPAGKCHFRRVNKRKAFDDSKMQIVSLQLTLKYFT